MRDLLESDEWKKSKAKIPVALGKDVYGKPMIADLAEMPHLLIAGATGREDVCMNSIIASLLCIFSDEMRMVMIDPKVVELQMYSSCRTVVPGDRPQEGDPRPPLGGAGDGEALQDFARKT